MAQPKLPGIEKRTQQVLDWMQQQWPAPFPVRIRWVKELVDRDDDENPFYCAETERIGKIIRVTLSRRALRTYALAIDTIIHEYAHARDTKHANLENRLERPHHGPEWGIYYAEMYSAYNDEMGWQHSREY